MAGRPLRLVDPVSGEILEEGCPACAANERIIQEYERKHRGLLSQLGKLRADRAREARAHELFPIAHRLYDHWKAACDHPRSPFTPDRFFEAVDAIENYGEAFCRRAIDGAAFDPYTTERRNGTTKAHNGWPLIFDTKKVEDFAARAPRDRVLGLLSVELPATEKTLAGMSAVSLDGGP